MTKHTARIEAKVLTSESAPRARDPAESLYLGILPSDDALLQHKGHGDIDFYRTLESDDAVYSCLQKRIYAQICRPWTILPDDDEGDEQVIEIITRALKRLRINAVCEMLMESLLTGFSVVEIVWRYETGARGAGGYWLPVEAIQRAPNRFVWAESQDGAFELRLRTRADMIRGEIVPDMKFIVHHTKIRDGNPNGYGLGRKLYWPVYFKKRAVIAWNKLNDRFGSPTPWGRFPRNASAEEKQTLEMALRAFSNDGYLATPEGTMIELLQSSLTGNVSSQRELCTYMDDAIAGVILGTQRREGSGGAQAAAAKEREDVRLEITAADTELLCDTLNRTLLAWMCDLNGWPRCQFSRPIKTETDREQEARADSLIASMGYRMSIDAIREKYGEGWFDDVKERQGDANEALNFAVDPDNLDERANAALREQDAIDAATAQAITGWQALTDPILDPLRAAIEHAQRHGFTGQQLLDYLAGALPEMDLSALAARLRQHAIAARFRGGAA